jgi:hypothetical protein
VFNVNAATGNVTAPGFVGTLWGNAAITGGNIQGATTITTTVTANVGNLITTSGVYWANGAAYSSGSASTNQIVQGASNVTVNSATSTVAVGISSSNVVVFAANGVTTTSNIYAQNSIGVQNSSGVSLFHIAYNSALGSIDTFFG